MKKLILLITAIVFVQLSFAQSLDQKTINIIKVKMMNAEDLYQKGEYYDAINKINEIEKLAQGKKSAKLQNLKVKCYVGWESFSTAQKQLDILYNMNPSDDILKDIASYSSKIDEGIKAEVVRKERERLASIKKEEKSNKLNEAYKDFIYKKCPSCNGSTTVTDYKNVKCTRKNSNVGHCDRGTYVFTNMYGTTRSRHDLCNGTGLVSEKYYPKCSECKGSGKTLQYDGDYSFSSSEIEKILKENRYKIIGHIDAEKIRKENEMKEYKRQALIELKSKSLTDTIFYWSDWDAASSKAYANYYRLPQKRVNQLYQIRDYYLSGELYREANSKEVCIKNDKSTFVGKCSYFSKSGKLILVEYYDNGRLMQILKYANGTYRNNVSLKFLNTQGKELCAYVSMGEIQSLSTNEKGLINELRWIHLSDKKKYYRDYNFKFDATGRLISRTISDKKGKILNTNTY